MFNRKLSHHLSALALLRPALIRVPRCDFKLTLPDKRLCYHSQVRMSAEWSCEQEPEVTY